MRASSLSKFGLAALCSALLASCAQSPTGRSQMLLFSPQQMNQLGADSFTQMKQQEKVSTDARMNAYVGCVAKAVTAQVPASYGITNWEVVVFDSKQVNAFALPGGKIGVYTGIFKVATSQDQLAAVIAHEIGHVTARHHDERITRQVYAQTGLGVAGALAGSRYGEGAQQTTGQLGGALLQGAFLLPNSRVQESEADVVGQELMAKAGFNPESAVALWRNMGAAGGARPPQWLSTHPDPASRLRELQARAAGLMPVMQAARSSGHTPRCR